MERGEDHGSLIGCLNHFYSHLWNLSFGRWAIMNESTGTEGRSCEPCTQAGGPSLLFVPLIPGPKNPFLFPKGEPPFLSFPRLPSSNARHKPDPHLEFPLLTTHSHFILPFFKIILLCLNLLPFLSRWSV